MDEREMWQWWTMLPESGRRLVVGSIPGAVQYNLVVSEALLPAAAKNAVRDAWEVSMDYTLKRLERDTVREEFTQLTATRKWCYYLQHVKNEKGERIPALVVEDHPEFFVLDYTLGPSEKYAQAGVDRKNATLKLSSFDVERIIASSFRASKRRGR